jgi:hypothetical protein
MADNFAYNIQAYVGRMPNFLTEVIIEWKEKDTPTITFWDATALGKAKPTIDQLNALDSQATTLENEDKVKYTRKVSYGDIGEQLDEIYKDIDAWKARIKKIKDDNPKS